jgi:hypothetical protein
MTTELRPLSFGELLDRTFSYYRSHFWVFVGIMAIPQVLLVAVALLTDALAQPVGPVDVDLLPERAQWLVFGGAGLLIVAVAYAFAYTAALGATTFAISEIHLGRPAGIRSAYRSMRGRIGRLFNVMGSVGIQVLGGFILFSFVVVLSGALLRVATGPSTIVGLLVLCGLLAAGCSAVLLMLRYAVAVPALLLENVGARQAMSRSVQLTKGYRSRIFMIGVLMVLVSAVAALVLRAPFSIAVVVEAARNHQATPWLAYTADVAGGVSGALSGPLLMIGLALAYYDVRVRKEGLDLQLMMASLGERDAVADAPVAEPEAKFKKTSVVAVILLSFITGGIYFPIWFLSRREAINRLRSPEGIGWAAPFVAAVAFSVGLCAALASGFAGAIGLREAVGELLASSRVLALVGGLLILLECFRVRRILLDHLHTQSSGSFSSSVALDRDTSFSGVATFFFGIYYLQYKINRFLGALNASAQVVTTEVAPAASAATLPPAAL